MAAKKATKTTKKTTKKKAAELPKAPAPTAEERQAAADAIAARQRRHG